MTAAIGTTIQAFEMAAPGEPMRRVEREAPPLAEKDVLVRVAGCGVCHTDIGFLYDGVRTRHALPLTLGHEISGVVEAAGSGAQRFVGKAVVVPAVIPCGKCSPCARGKGGICPTQIFPGNDLHGGFASHVAVPATGICVVPDFSGDVDALLADSGVALPDLSVLADAVSTPWQAIEKSGLQAGDVAVFVGAGGVGGFGVQLAAAIGAHVVALDIDDSKLDALADHGAELTINTRDRACRDVRKEISAWAKENGLPRKEWNVFETSGSGAGQEMAFGLLNHGAYLGIVGFTMAKVEVRLSNLMAFDARAEGTWGCLPELYRSALDLILAGRVQVAPFVERHPMSSINDVFAAVHEHRMDKRPVLVPDFD